MDILQQSLQAPNKLSVIRSEYAEISAVARVLPEFTSKLPQYVQLLADAITNVTSTDLRRLLHQLRGIGGTYGFPDISRLAELAEAAIDRNFDFKFVQSQVRELMDLISRVEGYPKMDTSSVKSQTPELTGGPHLKIAAVCHEQKRRAA